MKKVIIIMILAFFILGFLFSGCDRKAEDAKSDLDEDAMMADLFKPDPEIVALLSVKYNIDPIEFFNLMDKYTPRSDSIPDIDIDNFFAEMEKPNIERIQKYYDEVERLSTEFSIPKEMVASLIFDYQILAQSEMAADR